MLRRKGVVKMIEIKGKFNTAKCYASVLEEQAAAQIRLVCDQEAFAQSQIRIMPDVHAGMGCTIGTTMTIIDKVVPGMVGVDIGCGMETVVLGDKEMDFGKLDALIRAEIPYGQEIRKVPHPLQSEVDLRELKCYERINTARAERSIGTLGGGNHFIEVDRDDEGRLYLVVHSGSRNLGTQVAKFYQEEGWRILCGCGYRQIGEMMEKLKAEGRFQEIQPTIEAMKKRQESFVGVPKELAYVEGEFFEDYIHDMKLTQRYARLNRQAMTEVILRGMGLTETERFTTIHNYIDTDSMILRKGAVSAKTGEKLLIPINMRDGSLICIGKGNADWNCSAPHGAGRLMSRRQAARELSMEEFKASMEGIFTTCVERKTLDESPMAYKSMEDIVENIGPTAEIVKVIRPVYNFKAAE